MDESTSAALNARFSIPGQVAFRDGPAGLVMAELVNARGAARIALQGAQVVAFAPQGGAPVLFQSAHAIYAPGKAIRGGIPICWPWFGPHPSDPARPQHGFVRSMSWDVRAATALDDGSTELRLGLTDTPATRALWPQPFHLTLTVQVGRELRLALDTHNPGDQPLQITEALHSYFQIGDIGAVAVTGLEGTDYIDKVAGGQRRWQEGPVVIAGETDRVYLNTSAPCRAQDPVLGRRIMVTKEGSRSTVVWDPWREKAQQMADLGDDEYTRMICVEVANALDNAVVIPPGADHRLAMAIDIDPINSP